MGNSCGKPRSNNNSKHSRSSIVEENVDLLYNTTMESTETTQESGETTQETTAAVVFTLTTTPAVSKCQLCGISSDDEDQVEDDNCIKEQDKQQQQEAVSYCDHCDGHAAYCRPCWTQWITACEERRLTDPTCPYCRATLAETAVQTLLGGRPYQPAAVTATADNDNPFVPPLDSDLVAAMHAMGYRQCTNCQAWIERENNDSDDDDDDDDDTMECLCGARFCFDCGLPVEEDNSSSTRTCQCHNDSTEEDDDDESNQESFHESVNTNATSTSHSAAAVSPTSSSSSGSNHSPSGRRWVRTGTGRWEQQQ